MVFKTANVDFDLGYSFSFNGMLVLPPYTDEIEMKKT